MSSILNRLRLGEEIGAIIASITIGNQEEINRDGSQILIWASTRGNLDLVRMLLEVVTDPEQQKAMLAQVDLFHLTPAVRNIVNLPSLLSTPENPGYKGSKDSFVLEVMRKTYVNICNSFRVAKGAILTIEQIGIAEVLTRRVGSYIYSNSANIKDVRNYAAGFASHQEEENSLRLYYRCLLKYILLISQKDYYHLLNKHNLKIFLKSASKIYKKQTRQQWKF